jgi:hypothetical protein
MACNARFEFTAKPALAGVTVIDCSVAELTISSAEPLIPPNVAEIVAVAPPGATPVATPMLPAVLLMVATALLLAHTTSCVMFCVVPSLKVPIAAKVCVVSGAIVVLEGPTAIDWIVASVTTSVAVPVSESSVAVMVVCPGLTDSALPVIAPNVAAAVFDDSHVTCDVMLCLLPSL